MNQSTINHQSKLFWFGWLIGFDWWIQRAQQLKLNKFNQLNQFQSTNPSIKLNFDWMDGVDGLIVDDLWVWMLRSAPGSKPAINNHQSSINNEIQLNLISFVELIGLIGLLTAAAAAPLQ